MPFARVLLYQLKVPLDVTTTDEAAHEKRPFPPIDETSR